MRQVRPHLACFVLAIAGFVSSHALGQDRTSPIVSQKTTIAAKSKILFSCHTDQLFRLRPEGNGSSEPRYDVELRRAIKGEIRLSVDVHSHAITLLLQSGGEPMRAYVLRNVEQGSSPGSGTGGRADTTIRGTSAGDVFTLFAGYDSNGFDHDAALQVGGRDPFLLTCDGAQYSAPQAEGVGRYGSTNIYVLSGDGLAQKMTDLPVEPDFQGRAGSE
jgi:hypothetical protein